MDNIHDAYAPRETLAGVGMLRPVERDEASSLFADHTQLIDDSKTLGEDGEGCVYSASGRLYVQSHESARLYS